MCGRFTLTVDPADLQMLLNLGELPAELGPRYNIAPTQSVAVVADPASRRVEMFRWGLIPSWAKDPSIGSRMINARGETLDEKPAFRAAFKRRRCAVLADGFFEWQKVEEGKRTIKRPYHIRLASAKPFAFAGLWEVWKSPEGEEVRTCTIVTGKPNLLMQPIHDRMPAILDAESMWEWLNPDATPVGLHALLEPYPADRMEAYVVSTLVNKPENDVPECLIPVGKT